MVHFSLFAFFDGPFFLVFFRHLSGERFPLFGITFGVQNRSFFVVFAFCLPVRFLNRFSIDFLTIFGASEPQKSCFRTIGVLKSAKSPF